MASAVRGRFIGGNNQTRSGGDNLTQKGGKCGTAALGGSVARTEFLVYFDRKPKTILFVAQAVSHPRFGDEILRPGGSFFQFAAQVEDNDAEIGILLNIGRPPDLL